MIWRKCGLLELRQWKEAEENNDSDHVDASDMVYLMRSVFLMEPNAQK